MLRKGNNKNTNKWLGILSIAICLTFLAGQGFAGQKYPLGDIPLPKEVYKKHLKLRPLEMLELLPSSYDARADWIVTPAKNQGSCGSCWAFASVGAMESHILKVFQGDPEDLSEQQQVSCNTAMWGCDGGSANAIRYWELKGPVRESYFPYTAVDNTRCIEEGSAQLAYRVIDWHTVAVNDFKSSLYNYGPSYWRYDVHDDFYDYWSTGSPGEVYANVENKYIGGHAVLLIGWDDSKGAYLCKNSWGEHGGPNGDGTFWIAYDGHANNLNLGMVNFSLISLSCNLDAECDDGVFCNGTEVCENDTCQEGTPITCLDDGLFCNGSEVCDESTQGCGHTGDPCSIDETCEEDVQQCISLCGNKVCDPGENCSTCPNDCISGVTGGSCSLCFKGACDGICHPKKDGPDCADCWPTYCCGDGICEGEEDNSNCSVDCPVSDCGDGTCSNDEDQCSCHVDCGPPVVETCNNGIDDDCDDLIDCNDSDCVADLFCTCRAKKDACQSDSECCSGRCRSGQCR